MSNKKDSELVYALQFFDNDGTAMYIVDENKVSQNLIHAETTSMYEWILYLRDKMRQYYPNRKLEIIKIKKYHELIGGIKHDKQN